MTKKFGILKKLILETRVGINAQYTVIEFYLLDTTVNIKHKTK